MPRNIEMRERVSGSFSAADSLLYPKTHINMVEGLLVDGKLSLGLIPDAYKTGMKYIQPLTAASDTLTLYTQMTNNLTNKGLGADLTASSPGSFFPIHTQSLVITVSVGHVVRGDDGLGQVVAGGTVSLEQNDWLIYRGVFEDLHTWDIQNNTHDLATSSFAGLMSSTDKAKLDAIAAEANKYSHPTQTAIDVNTTDNGINVIDRVQVNNLGHVTLVSARNLSEATGTTPGVMSAADKAKLDLIAAEANKYILPTATASVLGGIKIGAGLSIASSVVSVDSQTEENFTTALKNKLDLIESQANKYIHPTDGANTTLSLGTNETLASVVVNNYGHVTSISKQTIRTASTSLTGIVQLASGEDYKTTLSSAKSATPSGVKTMIDYFSGLKRYADLSAANSASHSDGAIALITVA